MSPEVSIIILAYNQKSFIVEAVESALAQRFGSFEVVVADDASLDGTRELLVELKQRHSERLRLVLGETNVGVTANANRGLRAARGRLVAFQGGDDILLPGKLQAQAEWFRAHPMGVLCGHDVEFFDGPSGASLGCWSSRFGLPSGVGAQWMVRHGVPCCGTAAMLRRDVLPATGFDERLRVSSDWWLYVQAVGTEGMFGSVPKVLARYRRNVGAVSDLTKEIRPLQEIGREDGYLTLGLIEARYPQWAIDCDYGRGRLHYAGMRAHLRRGNVDCARKEWAGIPLRIPTTWCKASLLLLMAGLGPSARMIMGWQERRSARVERSTK